MPLFKKIKNSFSRNKPKAGGGRIATKGNKFLLITSAGIVLSILVMISLFSYENTQARYGQAYASIVNEQQVVSQQIATYALESSIGNSAAFVQLKRYQARFVNTLNHLRAGDPEQQLPAIPEELQGDLENVDAAWLDYDESITVILEARESIETVSEFVMLINESIPELIVLSDDVVKILNGKISRQLPGS